MTYSRISLAAALAVFAGAAGASPSQMDQIRTDLGAKGFTDIEIEVKGDRIIAEADRGHRDFEVVYDRNTGSIISQGFDDERPSHSPRSPQVTAAYEDLAARGLRDIDVDVKGDRIFAEGERNGREYEVVYDAATGAVLSEGNEQDMRDTSPQVTAAYDDLASRGLHDIDVDVEGDRIVAEGERNGRDYEVVYDAASGDVISEGFETDDSDRFDDEDDRNDRDDDDDDRDDDRDDDDQDDDDDDDRDDD